MKDGNQGNVRWNDASSQGEVTVVCLDVTVSVRVVVVVSVSVEAKS